MSHAISARMAVHKRGGLRLCAVLPERDGAVTGALPPGPSQLRLYRAFASELIRDTRSIIRGALDGGFAYTLKPDQTFVTDVDLAVEDRVRARIGERFPDHAIVGEERPRHAAVSDLEWIIDPIDGTHSLRHRVPLFGTILALRYRGASILGVIDLPGLDRCYMGVWGLGVQCNGRPLALLSQDDGATVEKEIIAIGERGQFLRAGKADVFDVLIASHPSVRTYCDCFGHALAVEGAVGAMVDFGLHVWDTAATEVMMAEVGGSYVVTQARRGAGGELVFDVVFGKPLVVDWILETLGAGLGAG